MHLRYPILNLLLFASLTSFSQAGIYSEADIELQDLFIEAQLEKQLNHPKEQIELLEQVIRRDRTADAAYYELAKAYFQLENYALAVKNGKKAHQINPENEWYLNLLTEIYEASSQYDRAIEFCVKLRKLQPENPIHFKKLAFLQLKSGQREASIATLLKLEKLRGIEEETSKIIFDIQDNAGLKEDALQTLMNISNSNPGNIRYLINIAGYLIELDRKEEGLEYYKRVIQLDPSNSTATLAIARQNANLSSIDGLHTLEEMITNENFSLDEIIQSLMPFISNMSRDGEQTLKLIALSEKLHERFPNDVKTYAVRADILFYSGKIEESEKLYEKAISLDDSKYTLWDQWLINLWELEAYTKMKNKALEAADYFPNQVNASLYYCLAAKKLNDHKEAQYYLEESKLMAGNNPRYKEAIKILEMWLETDMNLLNNNKHWLSSIDQSNITSPVFFELLGDLHLKAGDPIQTKKFWNLAVNMGADKSRIEQKISTLN